MASSYLCRDDEAARVSVLGVDTAKTVVAVVRRERLRTAAASLAFHAFNALIPFVLFVLVGLSLSSSFGQVVTAVGSAVGVNAADLQRLVEAVTNTTSGRVQAAAIAGVVLLWSAFRMFAAANDTFEAVYGTHEHGSFLETVRDILLVFVTVAIALGGLTVLGVTLSVVVPEGGVLRYLAPVALFVVLTVGFAPMYYVFPDVETSVREALPGALFAAAAWTLSSIGFVLYASISRSVHLYGVIGGLMLLLTWLYVGGLVLLVGIVINATIAGRTDVDRDG